MFQQEVDDELPELKPRSKEKPPLPWMNRRGEQAKHNHLVKSKDRLKQLRKGLDQWARPRQTDWTSKDADWSWDGGWSWEKGSWEEYGRESHEWDGWQHWNQEPSQPSGSTCAPVTPPKAPRSIPPCNDFGGGPVWAATREPILEEENAQLQRELKSLKAQVVELRQAAMPTGDTDDSSLEGLDAEERLEGIDSLDALDNGIWDGYKEVEVCGFLFGCLRLAGGLG